MGQLWSQVWVPDVDFDDLPPSPHDEDYHRVTRFFPIFRAWLFVAPPNNVRNVRPLRQRSSEAFETEFVSLLEHRNIPLENYGTADIKFAYRLFEAYLDTFDQWEDVRLAFSYLSTKFMMFPRIQLDDETWPAIALKTWRASTLDPNSPVPSSFTARLMAEYPVQIAPLIAGWFNELRIFDYAKAIETNFRDTWTRARNTLESEDSSVAQVVSSRDLATNPSEFEPCDT